MDITKQSDSDEEDGMIFEEEVLDNDDDEELDEELPTDDALLIFQLHKDSVFCCDLNKEDTLAVTGGEDDRAYVWNTVTGEIDFECIGHKDSVIHAVFSYDDKYVATGDMSGLVQVWSVREKKLMGTVEESELNWLKWHHKTNAIFCGFGNGLISIWDIGSNVTKILFDGKEDGCVDGVIPNNGKYLLSGYKSGELRLWNIVTATTVWTIPHIESIYSVHINQYDSLAICTPGAELIDIKSGKLVKKLICKDEPIEVAIFMRQHTVTPRNLVVTGTLSSWLYIWEHPENIVKISVKYSICLNAPITTIEQISETKVAIGSTSGGINIYNVKTGQSDYILRAHNMDVLSLKKFHKSNKILSTSDDETAKILEMKD